MAINKNDVSARDTYGAAYEALPKSVLALVAFYFAQRVADDFSEDGAFEAIADEAETLARNGLISEAQAKRAAKALRALTTLSPNT